MMTKPDEGYIKFRLNWTEKEFDLEESLFDELIFYRQKLYDLGLIGVYDDGIGFGNISTRTNQNKFIISGSATGEFKTLTKNHFALVTDFSIMENLVHCTGLTKASSESMTHAAIYKSNLKANAVIHIHQLEFWEKYKNQLPTTNIKAEFGTPEIANEIGKLAVSDSGIIIMGGHPEGIISYGNNLEQTYQNIIKYL